MTIAHSRPRLAGVLLAVILTVAAALPFVSSPAAPEPVFAHGNQSCLDLGGKVSGLISGSTNTSPNYYRNGVQSSIDLHNDACGDPHSAVSAWVALVPRIGQGQIVQAGIVQCYEGPTFPTSVCNEYPGQLRYFYAYGGCTLFNGPYARDAGPATPGIHAGYKVLRTAGGFHVYLPNGFNAYIDGGNIAVSCMHDINLGAQYGVEKWDRGDSSGGSTTKTFFGNMQYRSTQNVNFVNTSWSIGNCHQVMATAPHTSYCTHPSSNTMTAWD